jgi:hypothetical protein
MYLKHFIAVIAEVVEAKKAAAVVSDVTTTEEAAWCITSCTNFTGTLWPLRPPPPQSLSRATLRHTRQNTNESSAPKAAQ